MNLPSREPVIGFVQFSLNRVAIGSYESQPPTEMVFPVWVISHVVAGRVTASCRGVAAPAPAGTVMIHPPGIPFSEDAPGPGTHHWFEADLRGFPTPELLKMQLLPQVVTLRDEAAYLTRFHELYDLWQKSRTPSDDLRLLAALAGILALLLDEAAAGREAPVLMSPHRADLEGLVRYMQDHLGQRITREELAARASLHPGYLTRLFRAEFGTAPMQMLQEIRLQESMRLLQRTDLTVDTVAQRCGLFDAAHLGRHFRRRFGISPGRYRESAKRTTNRYFETLLIGSIV